MKATAQKFNRTKIFKTAWSFVKRFSMKFKVALKYAWSLAKNEMSEYFLIIFTKKDGTVTERIGRAKGIKQTNASCLTFFDFTKNAFSRAKTTNIVELKAVSEATAQTMAELAA